jgi:FkbM family methyltransferase
MINSESYQHRALSKLKHWTKLALHSKYRNSYFRKQELERIKNVSRYTKTSTNLLGTTLNLVDGLSFYYSYKEIIDQGIYCFESQKKSPIIIDGGSNIGLSVIYLKKLYPESRIFAFEADPKVFKVLKKNLFNFGYSDVILINKALWSSETLLEFAADGADAGRIAHEVDKQKKEKIHIHTVRLRNYLEQVVDFLKLDIEGAETNVILDCADCLQNVENLFIEYHSFPNEQQRLDELLHTLKKSNFRIQIQTQFCAPQPLIKRPTHLGMDLQLNIFGYRD